MTINFKLYFFTLFKYLIPQKDISFFSDYLKLLNSTANLSNNNNLTMFCFRAFLISFLLRACHLLYYAFGSLSEWERMQSYDWANILYKNNNINIVIALIWSMFVVITYTFFVFPANLNNHLLAKIVIQLNGDFFLNSTNSKDNFHSKICLKIKKKFLTTFNVAQGFMFAMGMEVIIDH